MACELIQHIPPDKGVIHNPAQGTPPTLSDTWVEMTDQAPTVGVGWLRGTIRGDLEGVRSLLVEVFGPAQPRAMGTLWYASSEWYGDRRVVVGWDGRGPCAGTVLVDVTQTALDTLGWDGSMHLIRGLVALGFRASRVDVWVDDHARHASARKVRAAIVARRFTSHAQPGGYREDDRTGAATAYLGARESERMLRVYDKDPGQGTARTRYELEMKHATAREVPALLLGAADAPRGMISGLLRGFVDFVDREDGERGDRAALTDWWAALVGDLERVKVAVARRVDSLARRALWVRHQVAPTLGLLFAHPGYGTGWLNDVLTDGLGRAPAMAFYAGAGGRAS